MKLKQILLLFLSLLLMFQQTPLVTLASVHNEQTEPYDETYVYLFSQYLDGTIPLLEEANYDDSHVILDIPNDTKVLLVEPFVDEASQYTRIQFMDGEGNEDEQHAGYVESKHVFTEIEAENYRDFISSGEGSDEVLTVDDSYPDGVSDVEITEDEDTVSSKEDADAFNTLQSFSVQSNSEPQVTSHGIALKQETPVYASQSTSSDKLRVYNEGTVLKYRTLNSNWYEATVLYRGNWTTGYIATSDVETITDNQQTIYGVGSNNPTAVYKRASTDSEVLRTYEHGSILKYRTFTNDWYEATVMHNGAWTTGYIHKNHVEDSVDEQERLTGVALRDRTHVYEKASTSSNVLRSYDQGSILIYRTFTDNWYEATVMHNGAWTTGYIHKNHVEDSVDEQERLTGVALRDRTHVYEKASTSSNVLRSYDQGSILIYRTFTDNWYEATVRYNGAWTTGYIHKNHVEDSVADQERLTGIGLNSPTHVYEKASTESNVLRTYDQGSKLIYRTFTNNWYEATVMKNGEWTTGYIHKNHVEEPVDEQESLTGIALRSPTHVYEKASTGSNVLRSYNQGAILKYRTYTNNWYEATVMYNGAWTTGYIHKNHVENTLGHEKRLEGYAQLSSTPVYERASKNSKVLRTYSAGHSLIFRTFSPNWYAATIFLNGERHTGYIHKDDVSFDPVEEIRTINYDYTFESMIDIQMNRSPKANGTGTIAAGRSLVEYYANPSNFPEGTNGFYQFLVLSEPAGLNASEVNNSLLKNAGTLSGTAEAFIEAGARYNINEAYLLAHALHETANGRSALASGIEVNGRTVYNMYGIRAFDGVANEAGSQHAYDQGWFTPEAAIIGGAEFIAKDYINRGQDTLYKMRWNPDNPGHRQYATHVAWAQITTNRIAQVYDSLDNYVQVFEVPQFIDQPGFVGSTPPQNEIEYPDGAFGKTTGSNVRLRSSPSTASNNNILTTIQNIGTELEILSSNGGNWYKAKYNGQVGWISSDFVNVTNVLEVTASSLNVRTGPSTSNSTVGSLSNGTLVRGVLDSRGNLVKNGDWYQIYYNGSQRWASSGSNHQFLSIK